jgi:ferrous iron transport protein B
MANKEFMRHIPSPLMTVVLAGLESSGKSALFRGFTGHYTGDESNFRGSTVQCRRAYLKSAKLEIVDTPGIRLRDDSDTTRLALRQLQAADIAILVVRATHAKVETESLLSELAEDLKGRKVALVITFADKAPSEIDRLAQFYRNTMGLSVLVINARRIDSARQAELVQLVLKAAPMGVSYQNEVVPNIPIVQPKETLYERPLIGPVLSIVSMLLLFAVPVYLAYLIADWLQPVADALVIQPLTDSLSQVLGTSTLLNAMLAGKYGIVTLGWYSFLWAFPVVVLISISVAITEEMGLKDRFTASLDPVLRTIGLNGRDLIPVLTGFGCNVVAVLQSRSCSRCTRRGCVSLIAFGSACSYQIGASLSLFSVGGRPWLFLPYLTTLFVVGAFHTRIWNSNKFSRKGVLPLADRSFLQPPTVRAIWWRVRAALRQFLIQAMPVFLLICVFGSALGYYGITDAISVSCSPVLRVIGLPQSVAPGIVFSIIRKDGLLVLNQGRGELLKALSIGQLFVLVFLASTFTACLVTLLTIRKELGLRQALGLAIQQALTSVITTFFIALIFRMIGY